MSDKEFEAVRDFHRVMDGRVPEKPQAFDFEQACHRAGFKLEEILEFMAASADNQAEFEGGLSYLHQALDKAATKLAQKPSLAHQSKLVNQADALLDLLYFTYGSFVLMGVDPTPLFDLVHEANMKKIWPDGKVHYDPVTGKILKPEHWERDFAPEEKIALEIHRQLKEDKKS